MTLEHIQRYAEMVDVNLKEVFAFLACDGEYTPKPFANLTIEIYSEESYVIILKEIANIGTDVAIKDTKINRWR